MPGQLTLLQLGTVVQKAREMRDVTQDQLAGAVDTSRTTIALLEQGRRLPDGDVLAAICRKLKIAESFWLPAVVKKLPNGVLAAVRSHSFTYYTSWKRITLEDERDRARFVLAVKNAQRWSTGDARQDASNVAAENLRGFFSHLLVGRTLVPVPTSEVTADAADDSRWPALRIAKALAVLGHNTVVSPLVLRREAIRKSSDPNVTSRPTVAEHITTLALDDSTTVAALPLGIVLVDDVVTRGSTLAACARLLRIADWPGEVEALTVAYTRGPQDLQCANGKIFLFSWDGRAPAPTRTTATRSL